VRSFVDHEVLVAEAESLGYARAPEVLAATKHAMVLKLLKERIGERPNPGQIDEAAARAYYDAHPSEFGPPERAVVALIWMHDRARAEAAQADAVRAIAAAAQGGTSAQFAAFQALVTKYTDEPGARDVTLALTQNGTPYPEAVVQAAASLKDAGAVSPLVSSDLGEFIIQLKERLPASVLPFERVKEHAMRSASEELRDKKTAAPSAELARKQHAEIHEERFAAVKF
jgi:peptidyl-prolyl cis-trans isomerase C